MTNTCGSPVRDGRRTSTIIQSQIASAPVHVPSPAPERYAGDDPSPPTEILGVPVRVARGSNGAKRSVSTFIAVPTARTDSTCCGSTPLC